MKLNGIDNVHGAFSGLFFQQSAWLPENLTNVYCTQELNIGGSIIVSALEETCGTNRSKIRTLYNNLGDLGKNTIIFCHLNVLPNEAYLNT